MDTMPTNLTGFIYSEIEERSWSIRELARRSELAHSTISAVLSKQAKPGPEFCNGIARAFREPPERIFRMAGLLPPVIIGEEREKELLDLFRNLDVSDQNRVITITRTFYEQRFDNDTEPAPKVGE